jgi:hypothetical protein
MLGFVPQPNLHGLRFLGKTYAVLGWDGSGQKFKIYSGMLAAENFIIGLERAILSFLFFLRYK